MSRKLICAMLLIITLLAACGKRASPTPIRETRTTPRTRTESTPEVKADAETETTVLRFAIYDWEQGQYKSLIEAFEAANPGVRIKTVSIEGTLNLEKGVPADAAVLLASSADVINLPASREAVQQETLLDLTPFIASDPNLGPEDFYPALLESVQWDGGTWSLPTQATYQMISYNKALFDAAGMAHPQPGWSWDDFLSTAQALTIREGDRVAQWGFVQPQFDPISFVQARAGLLFDPQTQPPTANLDRPAVAEAVQWYADLFLVHQVAPHTSSLEEGGFWVGYQETTELIVDGQAAMWIGAVRGQVENVGIVPFPVSSEAGAATTPVTVAGLSISRGTNKADLAWQWVSFLSQQQVNTRGGFYPGRNIVPALPSVAAAGGFWAKLDAEMAAALQYAVDHAYVNTYGGAGYGAFVNAVVDVFQNGTPVETALANAQVMAEDEIEAAVSMAPTPVPDLAVAEEEEAAIEAGAVVIQFGMGANRLGQQSFQDLAAQFREEHPDIVVELVEPNVRGGPSLEDMAGVYDCFQGMPNLNDDAVAAILSMEPFIASDATVSKEDFFPSVLEQFTYQGQVWGIPGSVTVNVVNYNKDLFDAAGLEPPSMTWTTSDFTQLATTLTQGEGANKQYGYLPGYGAAQDLVATIDRLGGDMYDGSVDPPRLVLNSPNVMDAVRWYASLPDFSAEHASAHVVGGTPLSEEERQATIAQGRVAIWSDSWGRLGTDLNAGVAPLPLGPHSAEGSGFQSVDGYFISAETEARQACWTWIAFLSHQPTAWGLPARQEVAESNAYRQAVGAERADAYIASVSTGSRASFIQRLSDQGAWFRFAYAWLSSAYDRIVAGDMTVEEAMNAAQEAADIHRDCAITNNAIQPPNWEALVACFEQANAAVPDLAGDGN